MTLALPHDPIRTRHTTLTSDDAGMLYTRCPGCSQKLRVQRAHAGKWVRCPTCHDRAAVPTTGDGWAFPSQQAAERHTRESHAHAVMLRRLTLWFSLDAAAFGALGWLLGHLFMG